MGTTIGCLALLASILIGTVAQAQTPADADAARAASDLPFGLETLGRFLRAE